MSEPKLVITARTRIKELLDAYPELEPVLIDLAPAFKKLKNPILRNTIARVTTIQQAAQIGEIPLDVIVNKLRGLTGQEPLDIEGKKAEAGSRPAWAYENKATATLDARDLIASGGHPLSVVLQEASDLKQGDVYLLITPFYPAPLVDKLKDSGFLHWSEKIRSDLYHNYFMMANPQG